MAMSTSRSRRAGRPGAGRFEAGDDGAAFAASAATAACVAAACVLPSLFDPRAERVFDEPKVLILRSVAALAVASALTWAVAARRSFRVSTLEIPQAAAPLAAVAMLTIAYVTASLASIAPRIAWDGAYVR